MTKTVLGYVLIVALVAGAVVAIGAWHGRNLAPVALSDGAPLVDASVAAFAEPGSLITKTAPRIVAAMRRPPQTTDKPGGEIVPWLDPLPPLTSLILSTDSPVVRQSAEELDNWMTLTVMAGVQPCFGRRPPKAVWAEFAAEFDLADRPSVKVGKLHLSKIHGDHKLKPEEASCLAENLQSITGHALSKDSAEALAPYFPMEHRFAFELKCGTCSAR